MHRVGVSSNRTELITPQVDSASQAPIRRFTTARLARVIVLGCLFALVVSGCGSLSEASRRITRQPAIDVSVSAPPTQPPAPPTALAPQESSDAALLLEATSTVELQDMRPTLTPLPVSRVPGRVLRVEDGDTIHVLVGGHPYSIRLLGINTPEIKRYQECFGPEAAEVTRQLVEGKVVYLEKDVNEMDKHQQQLRYVFVLDEQGGELHVNLELLRQGYARTRYYPQDTKYQDVFELAEQEARAAQRGAWAPETCGGIMPAPVGSSD